MNAIFTFEKKNTFLSFNDRSAESEIERGREQRGGKINIVRIFLFSFIVTLIFCVTVSALVVCWFAWTNIKECPRVFGQNMHLRQLKSCYFGVFGESWCVSSETHWFRRQQFLSKVNITPINLVRVYILSCWICWKLDERKRKWTNCIRWTWKFTWVVVFIYLFYYFYLCEFIVHHLLFNWHLYFCTLDDGNQMSHSVTI